LTLSRFGATVSTRSRFEVMSWSPMERSANQLPVGSDGWVSISKA
jgi:hypothetical protein